METRGSWGIVYVAAAFALIAIAVAAGTSYYEKTQRDATVVAVTKNLVPWQNISSGLNATSTVATPSVPLTEDLYTGYAALLDQGTFTAKERDQMLADAVQKNVQVPAIVPNITLADLTIATTSIPDYLKLLTVILNQSSQVHQYELNVFAAAVANENTGGTPELKTDALVYQKIAAAILLMQVPPQLASQHLEVAKSVGALAKAVANMGAWNGDPIQALVYVDSFNKAESYVQASVNNLLAAATPLVKKKS